MERTKQTRKISKILLLTGTLLGIFAYSNIAFAGLCEDISDATSGWVSCGEESTTFTEFEGGLRPPDEAGYDEGITRAKNVREYAVNVTNFALGFLGLVGVIMVIYGGFMYLTAGGEQEKIDKGKKAITYAIIGIIIVMASFAIVNTVIQAPGGDEKKGTAEGPATVDRNKRSFDMLANRVKTLAKELITAYQNYAETSALLDGIRSSIFQVTLNNPNDSWTDGLETSITSVKTQMEKIQSSLNNIADKTKSPLVKQSVIRFEQYWKDEYEEGYNQAVKAAEENGCKGCDLAESDCICKDDEVKTVLNKMRDNLCRIETVLAGEVPDDNDATDGCKEGMEIKISEHLLPSEKGGGNKIALEQYDGNDSAGECNVSLAVSSECMKAYAKDEFHRSVNTVKNEIKGIYEQVGSITSIGDDFFGALITLEELKKSIQSGGGIVSAGGGLQDLKTEVNGDDLANAEAKLKTVIGTMIQLIDAMKNIKFVDTVLGTDTVEGNSPLIVNFSALDSYDPSEMSIGATEDTTKLQVQWDLNGDGKYNDESSLENVQCFNVTENNEGQKSGLTPYCIYKKPGSYRVGLKVRSSNAQNSVTGRTYDQEIAEGRAFVTVKVNPPTTKIMLKANEEYIKKYDESGNLIIDRDKIAFTANDAQKGIEFNVEESINGYFKDQPVDYIKSIKWNFGDGVYEEGYSEEAGQKPQKGLAVTHQFVPGKYKVIIETVNTKNQKDRLIFDMIVKEIKADIKVTPDTKVKVGTKITIDGGNSKTDVGKITDYDWSSADIKEIDEYDGKSKFTMDVKKAGETKISLEVKNNNPEGGQSDTVDVVIIAESQPPQASFKYEMPFKNKPSEVHFDGSLSFDPDISEDSKLKYEWDFEGEEGTDFEATEESSVDKNAQKVAIRFLKKGTFKAGLTVYDEAEPSKKSTFETSVEITNILSVWWSEGQKISAQLGAAKNEDVEVDGETKVQPDSKKPSAILDFKIEQFNSNYVEWDFGDGETDVSDGVSGNNAVEISHPYTKSGKYTVKATAFDEEDNDLSITRSIFIGDSTNPIAAPRIYVDGAEQFDFEAHPAGEHDVVISRKSVVTFDASDSLNVDGTGRKLVYEWQFGDGANSTQKILTHTYSDVDLMVGGETDEEGNIYKRLSGQLVVRDKEDSSKKDEINFGIKVISTKPTLKSVTAVIEGESVETPVEAKVEAIGAKDEDGKIIQYRWFYFDVKENDVILGQQITKTANTKIKIGPRGTPGEERTYRFDVEMTDDENSKIFASKILPENLLPTLTVINGPNEPPVAKFAVDGTNVKVGDTVHFNSTSEDKDGKIIEYMWDLDGDGFENDEWTEEQTVDFKFIKSKQDGIKIRLKVRDNNYTESISQPVIVYVISDAEPPVAAFTFEQVGTTKTVNFKNNSESDIEHEALVEKFIWDFDTDSALQTADADGDGKKDNDEQSTMPAPLFIYSEYGTYKVKLTVIDTEGNEDSVTNVVGLKKPPEPVTQPNQGQPGTGLGTGLGTGIAPVITPQGTVTPGVGTLDARLKSNPQTDPFDNKIHLTGTAGDIEFDFSESTGSIAKYAMDKNIYYDTNGNGVNDDDEDFTSQFPIKWTTHFEKSWGKTMVKLTVSDVAGNKDDVLKEIVFDTPQGTGTGGGKGPGGMGVSVLHAGELGRMMPAIGILLFTLITAIAIKVKNYGK